MTTTVIVNVGSLTAEVTALIDRLMDRPVAQVAPALALPSAPAAQPGERYAGIAFEDGKPSHHLFLLDQKVDKRMTWDAADAWAKSIGAELPTRFEAALLYANLRDQFDTSNWHWTATQFSAGSAWIQDFDDGYQSNLVKDTEVLARAVRRLPL
jgi:hypothetical protein